MYCVECGEELPKHSATCLRHKPFMYCAECGEELPEHSVACSQRPAAAAPPRPLNIEARASAGVNDGLVAGANMPGMQVQTAIIMASAMASPGSAGTLPRPAPKNIIISHIEEDAEFAQTLKSLLEKRTNYVWQAFVRTYPEDIPVGVDRHSVISEALLAHRALIVLCSPASIQRFWTGYEAGCSFGRNTPIIPICQAGITQDTLPPFLSRHQGLIYPSAGFVKRLFEALNRYIPLTSFPELPDEETPAPGGAGATVPPSAPAPAAPPLQSGATATVKSPDCEEILRELYDAERWRLPLRFLTGTLGLLTTEVQTYGEALKQQRLIRISPEESGDMIYALTNDGLRYVEENSLG